MITTYNQIMQMDSKYILVKSTIPIYILSVLLSRFVSDMLAMSIFIVCFVLLILLRNQYFEWKKIFFLLYFLLVFSSIHFFAFCLIKIPDGETFESISDEKNAETVAIILSLPLSFIFSIVSGILFDFLKNKKLPNK